MRFGKPSSSFNVISNRAFILDASLPGWLSFTKKCYSMVAISHRESAKVAQQCRAICFVRAHAPKLCKCQKREQRECHFKLTGSASVCTRRSFSAPGTRLAQAGFNCGFRDIDFVRCGRNRVQLLIWLLEKSQCLEQLLHQNVVKIHIHTQDGSSLWQTCDKVS